MIATEIQLLYKLNSQVFSGRFRTLFTPHSLTIKRGEAGFANSIFLITSGENEFVFKQTKSQTLNNLEFFENELNYYKSFGEDPELIYFPNPNKKYLIFPKYDELNTKEIRDKLIVENKLDDSYIVEKKLDDSYLEDFLGCIGVLITTFRSKSKPAIEKFKANSTTIIQPKYLFFFKSI